MAAPWRRAGAAALLGALAWGLLFFNAAQLRSHWDLTNLGHSRRYWEDLTVAAVNHQLGAPIGFEGQPYGRPASRVEQKLRMVLPVAVRRAELRPWEFWRTVEVRRFGRVTPLRLRDEDDHGRAWLSRLGFEALAGVAPYLPLWLGVLLALPLFVWIAWETAAAGRGLLGATFLLLSASSAYVAEQLTLPYSTAGFYLVGLLLVVPLAVYAFRARPPAWPGLLVRFAAAGALFAPLCIGRGTVRALAPALALAGLAAAARLGGPSLSGAIRRRAGAALVAIGLALGPYLLLRPPFEHAVWMAIWEGLGDFDREKGFTWDDPTARAALRREGYVFRGKITPISDREMERIFKRLIVEAVAGDPGWYAGILVRRIPATVLQTKLWPREAATGFSWALAAHPNEGRIEYYSFTRTADWFGLGRYWYELPLPLLWVPLLALGAALAWPRGRARLPVAGLAPIGLVALAALASPILVTTASGPETQAFLFVYLLVAGLLVDTAWRACRPASGQDAKPAVAPAPEADTPPSAC